MEEALTSEERQLLEIAGHAGMPLPQVGEEIAGIPVDLAWQDLGIAWLSEAANVEEFAREAPGTWTVLGPDVRSAQQVLRQLPGTDDRGMVDP
jgi:hypothetical protein